VSALVVVAVADSYESLRAILAHERSFPRMQPHVHHEIALLSERLATNWTFNIGFESLRQEFLQLDFELAQGLNWTNSRTQNCHFILIESLITLLSFIEI
jgi:hypothetical protein